MLTVTKEQFDSNLFFFGNYSLMFLKQQEKSFLLYIKVSKSDLITVCHFFPFYLWPSQRFQQYHVGSEHLRHPNLCGLSQSLASGPGRICHFHWPTHRSYWSGRLYSLLFVCFSGVFSYFYFHACLCGCMPYVCCASGGQQRVSDPLLLELQEVMT